MPTENSIKSNRKIALVTGASRGLGRNTALNLARKGVDLIVTYHSNRADADSAVAAIEALGSRAVALQLDSSNNVSSFDAFVPAHRSVRRDVPLAEHSAPTRAGQEPV